MSYSPPAVKDRRKHCKQYLCIKMSGPSTKYVVNEVFRISPVDTSHKAEDTLYIRKTLLNRHTELPGYVKERESNSRNISWPVLAIQSLYLKIREA